MKRLVTVALGFVFAGTLVFAHGGNDHVRGVVTAVSAQSIAVQTTAPKATKTLTLSPKTIFKIGGKTARLSDLKVGDRVVVDVPEGKTEALEVQIGTAPQAAKAAPAHK